MTMRGGGAAVDTWSTFAWPEWLPNILRAEVVGAARARRCSPSQYLDLYREPGVPALGSVVELGRPPVSGRFAIIRPGLHACVTGGGRYVFDVLPGRSVNRTILGGLRDWLRPSYGSRLSYLHRCLLADAHVASAGLRPGREGFVEFLRHLQEGARHVARAYGRRGLPRALTLVSDWTFDNGQTSRWFVAYRANLEEPHSSDVAVSYYAAACLISRYGGRRLFNPDRRLPAGYGVTAEGLTKLIGVEECYHGHQHRVLGMECVETAFRRDHPTELQIAAVWERAVREMSIPLRRMAHGARVAAPVRSARPSRRR